MRFGETNGFKFVLELAGIRSKGFYLNDYFVEIYESRNRTYIIYIFCDLNPYFRKRGKKLKTLRYY